MFKSITHRFSRRTFATQLSDAATKKIAKLKIYLSSGKHQYDQDMCNQIVLTFQKSGLPVTVSTARSMGDEGIKALVESIQAQKKSTVGRKEITVNINVPHERHTFQIEINQPANNGATALAFAKQEKHKEIVQLLTAAGATK